MPDQINTAQTRKRTLLGRGKGYMSAAGPQSRFLLFLIFLLVAYTLLLRVFQKLAEIVELPVFLPISLVTLLVFIGIVGTIYSHKFVGPMVRIRRAIEHLAEGDAAVSLRLRDSDDPMLKDLVKAISNLSEFTRKSHSLIQSAARDLSVDLLALREKVRQGADKTELQRLIDLVLAKQEHLEKAIKACRKN